MSQLLSLSQTMSANDVRGLCRTGDFIGQTAGLAPGKVQANLMILPREFAFDFLLFCQRNPKPCPLVEVLEPGVFLPACAPGSDLRSDLPGYHIFRNGEVTEEVTDITTFWREDLVSFIIGCSFSFEAALIEAGILLRHVANGKNVSMYKTNKECLPAGRMKGNMVVSMRPFKSSEVARAVEISAKFPQVHGAPVHIGNPQAIGISNLAQPDFGDAIEIQSDEVPVFWACGVTPQYIAQMSKLPFCITHAPGKMFITDLAVK